MLVPQILGGTLDLDQIQQHCAPAVPQCVVGIGVESALESTHPMLQMHYEQFVLDRRGRIVESQEVRTSWLPSCM